MRKQIATQSREFNPTQWKSEMHELASGDPKAAADVATTWRERYHNMATEAQHITGFLMDMGMTSLAAGGMAYMDGMWDAERAEIERQWASNPLNGGLDENGKPKRSFEEAGVDDPAKLFGLVDTNLLLTVAAAAATAFKLLDFSKGGGKKNDYTFVARNVAIGGANTIISEMLRDQGRKAREKELVEKPVTFDFKEPPALPA